MKPRVLVADDQPDVVEALRRLLEAEGMTMEAASCPDEALTRARDASVDAALISLNYTLDATCGREGLDLLARLRQQDGTLPVVVMTAWASVQSAVEAMRRGASDYIEKPCGQPAPHRNAAHAHSDGSRATPLASPRQAGWGRAR